jgi:IS605 OrfB family transposase
VVVENGKVTLSNNKEVLGIDLGINNFAVCSDYTIIKASKIKKIKRRYAYLRRKLQAIGTPSAKRKLKKISGGERRFMADVNHCLSREIAEKPFGVFALENLKNVRKGRKRKKFNRMRSNWAYHQFRRFLAYKAEERGKRTILVNPTFTSLRCSKCGFIDKSNRDKGLFHCTSCGFSHNADLNASFNIFQLGKASLDRLPVNQPIVATVEGVSSLHNPPEVSYKPFNLLESS